MRQTLKTRLRTHETVLRALQRLDNNARASIMASAKRELVTTLVDCARAIINQRVPLSSSQYEAIRGRLKDIRALTRPKTSLDERRRILQNGGFLSALIAPALSLLPKVVKSIRGLIVKGKARRQQRRRRQQQLQQRRRR
jgi:hypothetical protein